MDSASVKECFDTINEAYDRSQEGYFNSWYDFEDDSFFSDKSHEFTIKIPELKGDIYISVESYYPEMTSDVCYLNKGDKYKFANYTFEILLNGIASSPLKELFPEGKPDWYPWFEFYGSDCKMYRNRCYKSGDTITVRVSYEWNYSLGARDFAVVAYS